MNYHRLFRPRLPVLLLAIVCTALAAVASEPPAAPYQPGDTFEVFTTKDQHGKDYTFTPGAKAVVVAFAMSPGKAVNRYLAQQPAEFLASRDIIFVSNIHGMPGIGRTFALPKMRKYPHRILLADAEHFLDRYPRQDDKITVFRLDPDARITAIEFVDPEKKLADVFAAPAK